MLINELNIQRFRGIPGSLNLNFTAPLTVLYAPNGTVKTSICDAAEWMLCGHIGRLNTLNDNEVRCRFGRDSLETFVEAKFEDRSKPYALKRILNCNGSILQRKIGAGEYSKVNDRELLNLLVDAIPPSGSSSKGQISWVRSTRFLESDSLSLLIDSDEESNDTRKLIFSNLFGVGEYQKTESELNRILGKLPATNTIAKEKSKIKKKISEYDKAIAKLISNQGEPYRDHVINLLSTIAKHLGNTINIEENDSLSEQYNQLEVESIISIKSLESKKTTCSFIRENLYLYQNNLSKKGELDKTFTDENNAAKKIADTFTKKKEELGKQKEKFDRNSQIIIDISNALEDLKITLKKSSGLYETYKLPVLNDEEKESRLDRLSKYVNSKEEEKAKINVKILHVEDSIKLVPIWTTHQNTIKGTAIQLKALQVSQSKDNKKVSLPERISKVKAKLDVLKASREKALSDLDLLLSSGKKYLESHENVSDCPLCEFKYESNSVLLGKINTRFMRLSDKTKEESSLASTYSDLTMLLQVENDRLVQFQELTNRKNCLLHEVQEIEERLFRAGISKTDLNENEEESLTLKLENIRVQHLNEVKRLFDLIKPYKLAFEAGEKLEKLLRSLQPIASSWFQTLEQLNYEEPRSLDDLYKIFIGLESLLNRHSLSKTQQLEKEKLKIGENAAELSKLEKEKNKKYLLVSSTQKAISANEIKINDFKNKWTEISKSSVIDLQETEAASSAIDKKNVIHNEIKGMFQKIQDYLVRIMEAEKKESERNTYLKELADAKSLLQELNNQEEARSVIELEISAIKKEIRRFIATEIQPLSNIINILYLRAQGNRFINSIEARPSKKGFLDWVAALDEKGEEFDKMRTLSQGQRQDLALSIFLARARSLGGTFFLDEPLVHLDDLNRVALLDTLRIIVSENRHTNPLRLVLTTASNSLLRHLREKFSLVEGSNGEPALRIYKMKGNPKVGLQLEPSELVHSPNHLL